MTTPQNTNGLTASCKGCMYGCGDCIENKRVLPADPKPVVLKYEIADHETGFVRVGYGEKEDPKPVSECCGAPVGLGGNTTNWYICTRCKMPCSLSVGEGKISPASADSSPSPAVQTPLTGEEEAEYKGWLTHEDDWKMLSDPEAQQLQNDAHAICGAAILKKLAPVLLAKNKELTDKLKIAEKVINLEEHLAATDGDEYRMYRMSEALESIRSSHI